VRIALASLAVVAVLMAAGCGSSSSARSASAPTTLPATTTTLDAPKPYDPSKPVDLGGTPGVTTAEQHRAEHLVVTTIAALRRYEYPSQAVAAGYRTIGDGVTGDEHFVKWSYVDDGHILDPNRPESLVYEWQGGQEKVAAAMYMLPFGSRFTDVPDVGGALTQWHVHDNLCLTNNPTQKIVVGLTTAEGGCPSGTSKAGDTPMLHVWTVPNPCGPFAALEGIGAGQVPKGQTRLCDTAHGSTGTS
jgi:hypothetical protein